VIQRLSANVFACLGIDHFVCFVDTAQAIASRIQLRDGEAPDAELISILQDAELDNAKAVANSLDLPLTVLTGFNVEGLMQVVRHTR
jgi:hypothetical protein